MNVKRITSEHDLHTAFEIRKTVFVEEQGCPVSDEFDEFDTLREDCRHILVYHENKPVGTARVRIVEHVGKLERICILKPYRKFGLGKVIVDALERIVKEQGISAFKLHGQTQAAGFYEKLGYQTASEEFILDGIPHVLMTKKDDSCL
ncbi:GNAT family N-acetyltransferase [Bacillus inaquosorum]|uniref:GNAT family N-acetyltransferase n=1 Tax=Bacillus inaquosorum TaxID=483913 RepID=UPI000E769584|nr:GNAT family N-acetyltransferase [Bacillus inaquosorum]RKQ24584.1 GNAT family N-acetyltransferase [Bacillus subtilis]MCY7979780.1 GNAT family N-acetyltransferase [Bacillus inaquosorum]MCY8055595.1 GNAT family N-acetyltransferase [Bacillus inaquosorum]MCY8279893.1 GNAT family N-acetyltransferase [Bacillus inaquosorum]MCY8502817.1 GNAT family N-acetyltransferase [Bacillus inaquosorum]